MTPNALLEEILRLPPDERLRIVEEVWDSIAADSSQVPVPDWHKAELDRRLADPAPEHLTWDQIQTQLFKPA